SRPPAPEHRPEPRAAQGLQGYAGNGARAVLAPCARWIGPQPRQSFQYGTRRLEPLFGRLPQAASDDLLQLRRGPGGERRRLPPDDCVRRLERRAAGERAPTGDHLVEDRAEREDVGAVIGVLPLHLFRRHVGYRSHDGAAQRLEGRRIRASSLPWRNHGRIAHQLGDAEVDDLQAALDRDEQVLRFEIAVHDSLGVRRRQAAGELDRVIEQLRWRQRRPQGLAQGPPLEQLANLVWNAVVRPDVV